MKHILSALCMITIVGCSNPVVVPNTAESTVFQIKVDYASSLVLETKYDNLPDCDTNSTILCSKSSVKKSVRKASEIANSAINDAEYAVRTPGFSDSKIVAAVATAKALTKQFMDITTTLKVK